MIRHGLCSPLENFSQKLVLKKKQLKLIYLLLFISRNNKSFKHQFRLSFLENREQETEENKLCHHWSFEVTRRLGRRCVELHCGNVSGTSFPRNLVIANQISYSVFQNSPIVQCNTTRTQSIAQP